MQIIELIDGPTGGISYIVADERQGDAIVIDAVESQFERERALLAERGLRPVVVAETHASPSGLSASERYRDVFGCTIVASDLGCSCASMIVRDGDSFEVGGLHVDVIGGEGDVVSYRIGHRVFAAPAAREQRDVDASHRARMREAAAAPSPPPNETTFLAGG